MKRKMKLGFRAISASYHIKYSGIKKENYGNLLTIYFNSVFWDNLKFLKIKILNLCFLRVNAIITNFIINFLLLYVKSNL